MSTLQAFQCPATRLQVTPNLRLLRRASQAISPGHVEHPGSPGPVTLQDRDDQLAGINAIAHGEELLRRVRGDDILRSALRLLGRR